MMGLLDQLDMDGCIVAGHSMGGFVAQQMAVTAASCVRALILICTAPKADIKAAEAQIRIGQAIYGLAPKAAVEKLLESSNRKSILMKDVVIDEIKEIHEKIKSFHSYLTQFPQNLRIWDYLALRRKDYPQEITKLKAEYTEFIKTHSKARKNKIIGMLKGIEKSKVIALTSYKLSGFLNKRVEAIEWITPKNRFEYNIRQFEPPTLGEVWSGSPYVRIIANLNLNTDLNQEIVHFLNKKRKPEMKLLAHSDNWGESIRLNSTLWLPRQEIKKIYADPQYIEIVSQIIQHVKTVRKDFGGLTF